MKRNADSAIEELARIVQVVARDESLRQQFQSLASMAPTHRANQIHIIAERMAADRSDPELVKIFRLFADTRIFEATRTALQECGYPVQ